MVNVPKNVSSYMILDGVIQKVIFQDGTSGHGKKCWDFLEGPGG